MTRTVYQIKDTAGRLIAEHGCERRQDGTKSMWWTRPGIDPKLGLDGYGTANLPLYGSERLAGLTPGQLVLACEGEKATEAAWALGYAAIGTVTGAGGTPGEDALSVLLPFDVVLWPDHDQDGRNHMARVAARLLQVGGACRLLRWKGAAEKGDDAADFSERGGSSADVFALVATAKPVQAVYVESPNPTPFRHTMSYGDAGDRKDRARESLADVVMQRLGSPPRREGRSLFWSCPFHNEHTASFKVDLREPFFRCFGCGARGDVFSFLGRMDGRSFKETLSELAPRPYTGILGRYAE